MTEALPAGRGHYTSREGQFFAIFNQEKGKKVRFEGGGRNSPQQHELATTETSRFSFQKDKNTGELPTFGEHPLSIQKDQGAVQESEEIRLKGKLRWLFEQDRMFWESNDIKISREGSEVFSPKPKCLPFENIVRGSKARESKKSNASNVSQQSAAAAAAADLRRTASFEKLAVDHRLGESSHVKVPGEEMPQVHPTNKRFVSTNKQWESNQNKVRDSSHANVPRGETPEFDPLKKFSSSNKNRELKNAKISREGGSSIDQSVHLHVKINTAKLQDDFCSADQSKKPQASVKVHWDYSKTKVPKEESATLVEVTDHARKLLSITSRSESKNAKLAPDTSFRFQLKSSPARPVYKFPDFQHASENDSRDFRGRETDMSQLDLGGEEYFTDYEDALNSRHSSELSFSGDSDDQAKGYSTPRESENVEELREQAAFLKAKCDLLSKEKDVAVRKWKRGCVEIDQAAQMAQALRSSIETLLEVSVKDPNAVLKTKHTSLEEHTQALKARMEKLRKRNEEGARKHLETEKRSNSLRGRIDTLKRTTEARALGSPEIPRFTEQNVEDLKARLERLMLATNSRVSSNDAPLPQVTDESDHVLSRSKEKLKKASKTTPLHEKAELKMKSWYNSLSAELTGQDAVHMNARLDKCDSFENACTQEPSGAATPATSQATSKQVSPLHPMHHGEWLKDPGSAHSSEDTKMKVIHKIAEEVKAESEQWFQVQELLQRVGEDMKTLQEACSTWERRAILAEAQVVSMHQEEQRKKERLQIGDQKIAELQSEILRLRDIVDDVRKQLAALDPCRWFEAPNKFGYYALVPVARPSSPRKCSCEAKCQSSRDGDCKTTNAKVEKHNGDDVDERGQSSSYSSPNMSTKRDSKLPSQQWAAEIAQAEEDEILQGKMGQHPPHLSRLEFSQEHERPGSGKQDNGSRSGANKEGLKGSASFGSHQQLSVEMQAVRERFLSQEDLSRCYDLNLAVARSPLKSVLGNIAALSKENQRPF